MVYRTRAATIESVLRNKYWNSDHWSTNYPGLFKDESAAMQLRLMPCHTVAAQMLKIAYAESHCPVYTVWYDDQVWSNYFNLSSPEQAAIIFHKLSTDGADEKVCR